MKLPWVSRRELERLEAELADTRQLADERLAQLAAQKPEKPKGIKFRCLDCPEDHGFYSLRPIVGVYQVEGQAPQPWGQGVTVQCVGCQAFYDITDEGVERHRQREVGAVHKDNGTGKSRTAPISELADLLTTRDKHRR